MILTGTTGYLKKDNIQICVRNWELTSQVNILQTTCQSFQGTTARTYISDGLKNTNISFEVVGNSESRDHLKVGDVVTLRLKTDLSILQLDVLINNISQSVSVGQLVGFNISGIHKGDSLTQMFVASQMQLVSVTDQTTVYQFTISYEQPYDFKFNQVLYISGRLITKSTGQASNWVYIGNNVPYPNDNDFVFQHNKTDFDTKYMQVKIVNSNGEMIIESEILIIDKDDIDEIL